MAPHGCSMRQRATSLPSFRGRGRSAGLAARLGGLLGGWAEVLPLHGTMRLEEQQRVIGRSTEAVAEGGRVDPTPRRVILATSLAETSLTVPGIRTVADSGWARLTRFHPATGSGQVGHGARRAHPPPISGAEGRAGWAPGFVYASGPNRSVFRPGRIPRFSGPTFRGSCWSVPSGAREKGPISDGSIRLPPLSWSQAWEILRMLDLLEDSGPTDLGRSVARLGLAPRLGVLVIRGADRNTRVLAAACAAILEERDGSEAGGDPDFRIRLEMIRTGRGGADSWRRAVGHRDGAHSSPFLPLGGEGQRLDRRAGGTGGQPAGLCLPGQDRQEGAGRVLPARHGTRRAVSRVRARPGQRKLPWPAAQRPTGSRRPMPMRGRHRALSGSPRPWKRRKRTAFSRSPRKNPSRSAGRDSYRRGSLSDGREGSL